MTNSSAPAPFIDRTLSPLVNDPRDVPFVVLSIAATLVVIPFAAILYIPGVFRWPLAVLYLAVNFLGFLDRYILMLHNTSHRALYRPKFRIMNHYITWVLGPFFGETPETYYAHHMGMHHPENNLTTDLSTTLPYRRDSIVDFLTYYFRFLAFGLIDLAKYLGKKNRTKLRNRLIVGEFVSMTVAATLLFVNWRATLVVFIIPVFAVRFLMMAGNWGQHAFVDENDPANPLRNSITVLADRYNRRCFNDGYHIGHHVKANRHWTELPGDFESNREQYARDKAIVFRGIDFFGVWFLLMLKRYDALAKRFETIHGERPSDAEIIALMKSRIGPSVVARELAVPAE